MLFLKSDTAKSAVLVATHKVAAKFNEAPPVAAAEAGVHVCSTAAMNVSSGTAKSMEPSGPLRSELTPATRAANAASAASR
jgi:hypothetical protein